MIKKTQNETSMHKRIKYKYKNSEVSVLII